MPGEHEVHRQRHADHAGRGDDASPPGRSRAASAVADAIARASASPARPCRRSRCRRSRRPRGGVRRRRARATPRPAARPCALVVKTAAAGTGLSAASSADVALARLLDARAHARGQEPRGRGDAAFDVGELVTCRRSCVAAPLYDRDGQVEPGGLVEAEGDVGALDRLPGRALHEVVDRARDDRACDALIERHARCVPGWSPDVAGGGHPPGSPCTVTNGSPA